MDPAREALVSSFESRVSELEGVNGALVSTLSALKQAYEVSLQEGGRVRVELKGALTRILELESELSGVQSTLRAQGEGGGVGGALHAEMQVLREENASLTSALASLKGGVEERDAGALMQVAQTRALATSLVEAQEALRALGGERASLEGEAVRLAATNAALSRAKAELSAQEAGGMEENCRGGGQGRV